MRKVLLGIANTDAELNRRICTALEKTCEIFKREKLDFSEMEIVFYTTPDVNDSENATYFLRENHIEIMANSRNLPTEKALKGTILQAALNFYIRNNFAKSWKNEFLFDIFRGGASLKFANDFGAEWKLDEFSAAVFAKNLALARDIISGTEAYDKNYWMDETGVNLYFLAWFFGEKILREMKCDFREITEKDFREFILASKNV